jgi:dihydrofolate synthase/folylpolyglutamate synthase
MTVGLAFSYFSKKEVDIAVIEVGMGGRLDGTNLIQPEFCVITNIGMDHTQFLGDSLVEIAGEKAGIIKPKIPVIIGLTQVETQTVFEEKSRQLKAEIIFADQMNAIEYESDLKGTYQRQNIQTAVVGLQHLKGFDLHPEKLEKGLMNVVANTGIQGRWQVINDTPKIVADVAHNIEGLQYIIPQIESHSYRQLHLVLGFVKDKVVDEILRLFPPDAQFYLSAPQIPRALAVSDLERITQDLDLSHKIFPTVEAAFLAAKSQAHADDFIYIGGSTFVVAEIL